ncbi:MAG: GAF domain-containing protein, partial [Candidatus Limnocylindria bacterium]
MSPIRKASIPKPSADELQRELAAARLDNARLVNESKDALEQQTAMSDVLRAISRAESDVQPVFETINEHAARLCHAPLSNIFLIDGEELRLAAWSPDFGEAYREAVGRKPMRIDRSSASGRSILERRTIHVADALADPEYARVDLAAAGGFRTMLAVPLLRDGVPIGLLGLARLEVRPFTDREIQLVETFANQAVIAIENVRLFNETKEALEQQTATSEVLKVISRSAFDLQRVLDTVIASATKLTGASGGTIWRRDGEEYRFAASSTADALDDTLKEAVRSLAIRPQEEGTVVARAALSGRPVQVEDAQTEPGYR